MVSSAHTFASKSYQDNQNLAFREKTLNIISSLRFGEDDKNFLYVVDTKNRIVLSHGESALIGKSVCSLNDSERKTQLKKIIEIAVQEGARYNSYTQQLPGQPPQSYISYIQHFPEWNMGIAARLFLAEVDKVISVKRAEINVETTSTVLKLALVSIALIIGSIMVSYFMVYGGIVKPIRRMIAMLKDIAEGEGDLTKRIHDDSGDETEEMADWFNQFIEKIQHIIRDVSGYAATLEKSSEELNLLSQEMTKNASQTSDKSNTVAAAGEQMSSNMQSVAAAMEEAATIINMVAAATEEMSSTINEIAENAEKAREITGNAVTRTTSASNQVEELGRAAREMGRLLKQ